MFCGRHDDESLIVQRDVDGRVYLDYDPELIEIIVDFLRMKKIEDQTKKPVHSPCIPDRKKDAFKSLLQYFELTEFFYQPTLDIANIGVVQSNANIGVVQSNDYFGVTQSPYDVQFHYEIKGMIFNFILCTPSLVSSGKGSF